MENDLISRQAAIELVKDVCDAIMSGCESRYDPETEDEVYTDIREVDAILKCNKEVRIALRNMPSAQPEKHTEERTETHACDLIDRQAAIDAHYEYCNKHPDAGFPVWSLKILEDLPPSQPEVLACGEGKLIAQPEREKGHWIRHPEQRNIFNGKTIECSECHEKYTVQYVEDELFCRHCGADMREPEDIPMEYFESGGM